MNSEARAFIDAQLAEFAAKKQAGIDLLNQHRECFGNDALILVKDQPEVERRPWCAVVLHPSPRGSGVQRTYFDERGFSGHEIFKTFEEAAADAYVSGYRRPDPTLLDVISDTDLFEAGNRWTMLPGEERWNISIDDILRQVQLERQVQP